MSDSSQSEERPERRKNEAISLEKKKLLVKFIEEEGKTLSEAAASVSIKLNTAKSIYKRYRDNAGEIDCKSRGGNRPRKLTDSVLAEIEKCIEENPGITIREIQRRLQSKDIRISKTTVDTGLREIKITLKLARFEIDRINCESTIELRKQYALDFTQSAPGDASKMIFIDECGFNLHLRRSQARSKKNTRAYVTIPTMRGRNITLIAAMNNEGIIHKKVISNSTCNSEKFCIFLRDLIEKLGSTEYAWLIMDNARIHKTSNVREIVAASSFNLKFLPPYSPMLNPIEKAFSKIKNSVRSILSDMSEQQSLPEIIERSSESVTSSDCVNFIMDMMMKIGPASRGEPVH